MKFANRELELLECDVNKDGVINVLKIISGQGHSGNSIAIVVDNIEKGLDLKKIKEMTEKNKKDKYGSLLCKCLLEIYNSVKENKLRKDELEILVKLIKGEPLNKLMFTDEEWEIGFVDGARTVYQNKRCSSVFKDDTDGKPYYIDAVIKRVTKLDGSTMCWTGPVRIKETGEWIKSSAYIKDANFIEPIYVDVEEVEIEKDNWEMYVSLEELEKVKKHYDLRYL